MFLNLLHGKCQALFVSAPRSAHLAGSNWNWYIFPAMMSRLRLSKKRSMFDNSSTSSSKVQVSAGSNDFKRVDLHCEKSRSYSIHVCMYMTETSQCICRSLIHELLLGDAPYKFNPFPPSKVELNDVLYIL